MSKNVTSFIVRESDNLERTLLKKGFPLQLYHRQIELIGSKVNNNKIGFAQFGEPNNRVTLRVTPKILSEDNEEFLSYLNLAFKVIADFDPKVHRVDSTLLDLSNHFSDKESNSFTLEDIAAITLKLTLTKIQMFMKSFKVCRVVKKNFSSNAIKCRLDVGKNVIEVDSAKVHQTRKETRNESLIADYTSEVLYYFSRKVCSHLSDGETLRYQASRINAFIKRRYQVNNRSVRICKLNTSPVKRQFKSANADELYLLLLRLLGEPVWEDEKANEQRASQPISDMTTFFIDPAKIYELFIFLWFSQRPIVVRHHWNISYEPVLGYDLVNPESHLTKLLSKPDFVLTSGDNKKRFVVDVKWKVVSKSKGISIDDIVKLQRDWKLHSCTDAILVYPKVPKNLRGKYTLEIEKGKKFEFWVIEVPFQESYILKN
ncbi:TPA: 5-methylcytosine restriction system specificity protein McrC [Photobacterium damselae]